MEGSVVSKVEKNSSVYWPKARLVNKELLYRDMSVGGKLASEVIKYKTPCLKKHLNDKF